MSSTKYQELFIRRSLDDLVYNVSLKDGEDCIFENAIGRLVQEGPANKLALKLSVFHDPAKGMFGGRYQPKERLLCEGLTRNGEPFECQPMWASQHTWHAYNSFIDWFIRFPSIRFMTGLSVDVKGCAINAFVDPVDESIFTKHSERKTEGFQETQSMSIDWLEFKVDGFHFALRRGDEHASALKVSCAGSESDTLRGLQAFLCSLSLALGRRITHLTSDGIKPEEHFTVLYPMNRDRLIVGRRYPLLIDDLVSPGLFLPSTTKFFLEHPESPILNYVGSFWDATGVSFQSSCLHVTSAVEGLYDLVLEDPFHKPIIKAREKEIKDEIKQFKAARDKIVASVDTTLGADERFNERFKQEIKYLQYDRPAQKLLLASQILQRSVNEDEAENWRLLRNQAAHGAELNAEDASTWEKYYDSIAILYRLAAGLVGWTGSIVEHGATRLRKFSGSSSRTNQYSEDES